jgi:hypothetical protein
MNEQAYLCTPKILSLSEGKTEVLTHPARGGKTFPEEVRQGSPCGERLKGIIFNTWYNA